MDKNVEKRLAQATQNVATSYSGRTEKEKANLRRFVIDDWIDAKRMEKENEEEEAEKANDMIDIAPKLDIHFPKLLQQIQLLVSSHTDISSILYNETNKSQLHDCLKKLRRISNREIIKFSKVFVDHRVQDFFVFILEQYTTYEMLTEVDIEVIYECLLIFANVTRFPKSPIFAYVKDLNLIAMLMHFLNLHSDIKIISQAVAVLANITAENKYFKMEAVNLGVLEKAIDVLKDQNSEDLTISCLMLVFDLVRVIPISEHEKISAGVCTICQYTFSNSEQTISSSLNAIAKISMQTEYIKLILETGCIEKIIEHAKNTKSEIRSLALIVLGNLGGNSTIGDQLLCSTAFLNTLFSIVLSTTKTREAIEITECLVKFSLNQNFGDIFLKREDVNSLLLDLLLHDSSSKLRNAILTLYLNITTLGNDDIIIRLIDLGIVKDFINLMKLETGNIKLLGHLVQILTRLLEKKFIEDSPQLKQKLFVVFESNDMMTFIDFLLVNSKDNLTNALEILKKLYVFLFSSEIENEIEMI